MLERIVIPLPPITKKNHQQIFRGRDGRPFVTQSQAYKDYEKAACLYLRPLGINFPVNIKATYYMPTLRVVDLINLHSALHDVLVKAGVLEDDNFRIVASTDGSRVEYDKKNPRTEVEITDHAQRQITLF